MSKKLMILAIMSALVAATVALPADAAKKKKKPKPVATVMFLEGTNDLGEQDAGIPVAASGTYLQLTAEAGSGEKSMGIPSYMAGPNNQCAGNSLFPVFQGNFAGTITGDLKVSFEAVGTPSSMVEVRVWTDIGATPATPACNDAYIEPAGKVEVAIPSSQGLVEAVIPGLNLTGTTNLMIQLTGLAGSSTAPSVPPFYARAFYGLETTKIEFSCTPAAGASTCIPG